MITKYISLTPESCYHLSIFNCFGRSNIILYLFQSDAPPFPNIQSTHSLVAKHVTEEKWKKLGGLKTATSGFTLGKVMYMV